MNVLALLVDYLNGAYVAEYAPERGKKMEPIEKKIVNGRKIEMYLWNSKYVVYIDNNASDLTYEEAIKLAEKEVKTWAGIRCRSCGTLLIKGKCPVTKKDCGRP